MDDVCDNELREKNPRMLSWERRKHFEERIDAAPALTCLRFGAKLQGLLAEFPSNSYSCCGFELQTSLLRLGALGHDGAALRLIQNFTACMQCFSLNIFAYPESGIISQLV